MTNEELIKSMQGIKDGIGSAHVLYVATTSTMDVMSERIWRDGKLTSGGKLTYKGPTPKGIYIYSPPWPKKGSGKGKPNAAGKSKKIKGTWAPSYIAGKGLVGRGDLPFELTGDLRKDWLGGAIPTPNEVTPYRCTIAVNQKSLDKIDGLTETKGAFVELSSAEIQIHHLHVLEAYRELVLNVR
jgi:hypothetical protein